MTNYYFTYGSTMYSQEMNKTCPHIRRVGTARLDDYRIAFTWLSSRWGGGVANTAPAAGLCVWGALYTIDRQCQVALDLREVNGVVYIRTPVTVYTGDRRVQAITYRLIQPAAQEIRPTEAYLHALTQGAAEANLPQDYQEFLVSLWAERQQTIYREGFVVGAGTDCDGICVHPADAGEMEPGHSLTVTYLDRRTRATLATDPEQAQGTCRLSAEVQQALQLPVRYGATVRLED